MWRAGEFPDYQPTRTDIRLAELEMFGND